MPVAATTPVATVVPPEKPAEAAAVPLKNPALPMAFAAETADKFALRVHCGGATNFTDKTGRKWLADQEYGPGKAWGFKGPSAGVRHHPETVAQTDVPEVFCDARISPRAYVFEVPKGRYTVRLGFAEPFVKAASLRLFTIKINGTAVLENLDLFKETGGQFRALVKEFKGVEANGGTLTIELVRKTENPLINCVEILQE
jgi:hypothetical protein